MNKKELKTLKAKIKAANISQPKLCDALDLKLIWLSRMLRGDFHEPNPEWISKINEYLDDMILLQSKYR